MDLFSRLFQCCHSARKDKETDKSNIESKINCNQSFENQRIVSHIEYMDRGLLSEQKLSLPSTNQRDQNDELLINERFIREDEKEKIRFSINGIIGFINKISDEDLYDWITLYNKNGLEIYYQNGSILSNSLLLGKTYYKLPKNLIKSSVNYNIIAKVMYDPEIRMKYDLSLKEFKIYEKGENYNIFRVWMHSPIFFISERDVVDKRIEFIKDDVYYNLATSVNDDYDPPNKDVVRCKTYLNMLIIKQDNENFYFHCLSQFDAKTVIPEKVLNITIPFKTQEWFNKFLKQLNIYITEQKEII